jgi:tRNA(fMet)-specific endonuclease VapC
MTLPLGAALLDTDILSAVMRQNPAALARARAYLAVHHRLTFSIITRYEVLRGLHTKNAMAQLAAFDRLCSGSTILPLTDAIVVRAATIYADLHQRGALIGDADMRLTTGTTHRLPLPPLLPPFLVRTPRPLLLEFS